MRLAEEGSTSVNLSSLSSLKDLEPGELGVPVFSRRELKFSGAGGAWKPHCQTESQVSFLFVRFLERGGVLLVQRAKVGCGEGGAQSGCLLVPASRLYRKVSTVLLKPFG